MSHDNSQDTAGYRIELLLAWLWVGIPLAWGVVETGINAAKFFQ